MYSENNAGRSKALTPLDAWVFVSATKPNITRQWRSRLSLPPTQITDSEPRVPLSSFIAVRTITYSYTAI